MVTWLHSGTPGYPATPFRLPPARGFLNAIRNWIFYWVRIAMLGMLAILSGTIWLNLGHSYGAPAVNVCQSYSIAMFMHFTKRKLRRK